MKCTEHTFQGDKPYNSDFTVTLGQQGSDTALKTAELS